MTLALEALLGRGAPWLMGIVNVTPDSFADGGQYATPAAAVRHARQLRQDGAAVIDVGGESTAPGRQPMPPEVELARVEPVVAALADEMILSIDSYHANVAARSLELGARIVNDVSALRADPAMARVVAEHDAWLVLMHAKDGPLPHATDRPRHYQDVVDEIGDFLLARIDVALRAGIAEDRLVVDPGWGRFISLDPNHTWQLLAGLERLVERVMPVPVMVATSRKGFLEVPMADRDPLSQLTALIALQKGATLVRTHHIKMSAQFVAAARKMSILP